MEMMQSWSRVARVVVVAGAMAGLAGAGSWAAAQSVPDAQVQADLMKSLNKKEFRNVTVKVTDGHVVLSGTVDRYADKMDAEKRTHLKNRDDVKGFENDIQVAGPEVDDRALAEKLAEKLEYDRVGYGTTTFNAITVSVQNGMVTLGGVAYGPPDRDSAVGLVANYPGVKGVVDHIDVEPVSPNDDRIRIAEQRAIYGFGPLQKYAINPGKPIRIAVKNGNVTLVGVVDSQGDKDLANLRANQVPGVFSVKNDLQVAGSSNREPQR